MNTCKLQLPNHLIIKCKRFCYNYIQSLIFKCNGTIYGAYVRDKYISEYYTDLFYKSCVIRNDKRYWNKNYSPETSARLLLPEEMEVSFKTIQDADSFISSLTNVKEFHSIAIIDITNNLESNTINILNVKNIAITMILGAIPFVSQGKAITIYLSISIPKYPNIEPPFYNLDMLCNGFIMTKEGITLSGDTGTYLDCLSIVEKQEESMKIMKDMLQFKTEICMSNRTINKHISTHFHLKHSE